MRLALLQCDVKNGDLCANAAKIGDLCQKAQNVDLCVVAQEALAGPAPGCINPGELEQALNMLARNSIHAAPLLCAAPGRGFMLIQAGKIAQITEAFEFMGLRIGINYGAEDGALVDLNINMASRAFAPQIQEDWELVLSGVARQGDSLAVSANLVGGYAGQIYNGQSCAMARDGSLIARALPFAEDVLLVDSEKANRIEAAPASPLAAQWQALVLGLSDFVKKAGATRALLGLSGGMDSALVACLACAALGPENVCGVLMPSVYTSAESLRDADELARNLGMRAWIIPIEPMRDAFQVALGPVFNGMAVPASDLVAENLQARIRGVLLMAIANRSGALVLNTGNKSEAAMGYCTLYGDTVGAVAVIGDLFKTEVYALARWYCANNGALIPRNVFERPPTAELRPDQKDTDSLPPYEILDPELAKLLRSCDGGSAELRARVNSFEFKRRQCPPPLLVSGLPLARLRQIGPD